ncbi:MAG: Hsp20/alpha crystallin family protein [Burkholderiaceae bacterium]
MDESTTHVTQANQVDQPSSVPQQTLTPAVDITENESGIMLLADMPGVSKDRLTIKVEGDNLMIEGRAQIDVPENIELLHSEVRSPYFRRSFTLSRDLDPGKIEATLRNGVLQLQIPKSEEARPRRIEVKVA